MINSSGLSLISLPLCAWYNHLPSFIYWLKEQGHLRAPAKAHSFFPVSLLIFWEADRWYKNWTPNKPSVTTPAETPEMNHIIHAFLSVIVPHWLQKNAIWKPSGGLVWGHVIRLGNACGGEGLEGGCHYTTTHVLFSVLCKGQVYCRVLKPDRKAICSLSLGLHNSFLK